MELSEILRTESVAASGAEKADTLGQADFLRMLIAQLENQDPLDPQDATEFTAQLAQFSSLDQLISMRESIDALSSSSGLAAAGLIGRTALVQTRLVEVPEQGDLPGLALELPAASEVASVELLDARGVPVSRTGALGALPAGRHELGWEAFDPPPAPGLYSIRAQVAPGAVSPVTLVRAPISGAVLSGSSPTLLLGPVEVPISSVREIGS